MSVINDSKIVYDWSLDNLGAVVDELMLDGWYHEDIKTIPKFIRANHMFMQAEKNLNKQASEYITNLKYSIGSCNSLPESDYKKQKDEQEEYVNFRRE